MSASKSDACCFVVEIHGVSEFWSVQLSIAHLILMLSSSPILKLIH